MSGHQITDEYELDPYRHMMTMHDVAYVSGYTWQSIKGLRRRGKVPNPDALKGQQPLWNPLTIDEWVSNKPPVRRPRKNKPPAEEKERNETSIKKACSNCFCVGFHWVCCPNYLHNT